MARIARVVVPGFPHHVTQRGNRRQQTFFSDDDYIAYKHLMTEWCGNYGTEIWAYCLMPNHVHLVVVPQSEDGLRKSIGEAHRRYTRRVNFRENWRGHLWQGRFASFPMNEAYLLSAVRYVELNPVRANIVKVPEEYPWSSAAAHIRGVDDDLVKVSPMLELVNDWHRFLSSCDEEAVLDRIRRHESTGRPLGGKSFVDYLERLLDRPLTPQKPGRKTKPQEK